MTAIRPAWLFSVLAVFALTAGGCGPTQIRSSWMDAGYAGGALEQVMIVGIADKTAVRRIYEDTFARELAAAGVAAQASYPTLPAVKKGDAAAIKRAAQAAGIDRVLVTHLVGVEKKEVFNPPVSTPMPDPYYHRYGQYYSTVHQYVNEPGYYTTHEFVMLESNLYETGTEALIWSAATETIDPKDTEAAARDLCRALIRDLKKQGLIP